MKSEIGHLSQIPTDTQMCEDYEDNAGKNSTLLATNEFSLLSLTLLTLIMIVPGCVHLFLFRRDVRVTETVLKCLAHLTPRHLTASPSVPSCNHNLSLTTQAQPFIFSALT